MNKKDEIKQAYKNALDLIIEIYGIIYTHDLDRYNQLWLIHDIILGFFKRSHISVEALQKKLDKKE